MTERTEIPNKNVLPLLPLKGTVIMPHQVAPLGVGRPKSLRALETALAGDRMILLAAQMQDDEPGKLADLVSQHLPLKLEERQQLLELAPKDRLELLSQVLTREVNILELERKIQNRVRKQMEKSQREYFLKEQMKAIQQE